MTQSIPPVGGFVLVGGGSRRMGRDKALLELGGQPLFLRMVELLRPYVAEVALLGPPSRFARFGLPVLPDRHPGRGPLEALCTGLESSLYDWNVFLACDLPFLEGRFLRFLVQRALSHSAEAVLPRTADGWQPLCGVYHRHCRPRMEQALRKAPVGIVDVLPELRADPVETDELTRLGFTEQMFTNVNTPADWNVVQSEPERKKL